jgi:hypothetical protein
MLTVDFLKKHNDACSEGQTFARQFPTMAEAWDACPRVDWMLWALREHGVPLDQKVSVSLACWCVRNTPLGDGRTTWDLLTDERSRNAIVVTERYMKGEASREDVETACDAAYAACDAADAAHAAACAARAAQKVQADHLRTLIENPFK